MTTFRAEPAKVRQKVKDRIIGPWQDPVRQQGRDPAYIEREPDWFDAEQGCDRSRLCGRPRVYHVSNRTSSGATFDEHFEHWAERAREFEDAGINLGWGGCSRKSSWGTYEWENDRRYAIPACNQWRRSLKRRLLASPRHEAAPRSDRS